MMAQADPCLAGDAGNIGYLPHTVLTSTAGDPAARPDTDGACLLDKTSFASVTTHGLVQSVISALKILTLVGFIVLVGVMYMRGPRPATSLMNPAASVGWGEDLSKIPHAPAPNPHSDSDNEMDNCRLLGASPIR